MHTTVDIKPEQNAALRVLTAQRGQRGISSVLKEAIDCYLGRELERTRELRALAGSLSENEAAELRAATRRLRESWC